MALLLISELDIEWHQFGVDHELSWIYTDCLMNLPVTSSGNLHKPSLTAYVTMPFSKVQCYAGDRCSATVGNSSDPNSDTFVAQGPFQCGTCPTVNGMQTAPTQVPRLAQKVLKLPGKGGHSR